MTVDDYLGGVDASARRRSAPPPPETVAAFNEALERALALARERVAANPRDADAHYQLGAAIGLRASYTATVEGSALGAFRAAREAYDEHEKVLQLDTRRKDAGLIVGTYRYIVAALSLPLRWVAYMAGFGGGREQGLQLVEDAAAYGGDNQDGSALRADPPLQPREAVRRCAEAAGDAARPISRGTAWCGSKAGRRACAPAGPPTPNGFWTRACAGSRPTRGRGCSARTRCGTPSAAPRAPPGPRRGGPRRSWRRR